MTDIPQVLFVCSHNAGRSQMAAALLDHEAAGRVRVTPAGSQPANELNPAVVQAMAEIGLDLTHEHPRPLTTDKVQVADIMITMGQFGAGCNAHVIEGVLMHVASSPAGGKGSQPGTMRGNQAAGRYAVTSRRVKVTAAAITATTM